MGARRLSGKGGGETGILKADSRKRRKRNSPRKRKPISLSPRTLQELDVFSHAVVRIASYGAAAAVGDLAGFRAVDVPYGWATTVFFWGAFDLVAVPVVSTLIVHSRRRGDREY